MPTDLTAKIAEARRLEAERAPYERTIEEAQWFDNYRDAARARDRLAQIDAHDRNHHAALWAVVEAAQGVVTMDLACLEPLRAALRALAEVKS